MGQHMAYSAASQEPVPPMTTRVSPWSVYRLFETEDDQLVFVGITSDKHWQRFCPAFDRMDLLADESLATNEERLAAQDRLMPQLEAIFAGLPLKEIVQRCEVAEIPFSPIAHPEDLFEDPQLNAGDSLVAVHLPDGRQTKLPRLPLALDGTRPGLRMEAPQIGEHTRSLLMELDYSQENIDDLHQAEVVVAPPLILI